MLLFTGVAAVGLAAITFRFVWEGLAFSKQRRCRDALGVGNSDALAVIRTIDPSCEFDDSSSDSGSDFVRIKLPDGNFEKWLARLDAAKPPSLAFTEPNASPKIAQSIAEPPFPRDAPRNLTSTTSGIPSALSVQQASSTNSRHFDSHSFLQRLTELNCTPLVDGADGIMPYTVHHIMMSPTGSWLAVCFKDRGCCIFDALVS